MGPPPDRGEARAGRGVPWPLLLVTALLAPPTAWTGAYLWAQTDAGQAALRALLLDGTRPGALTWGRLAWGPAPGRATLLDVTLLDRHDKPALRADVLDAELDAAALVAGRLHLRRARARRFEVRLGWDAEGTFNLKHALRPPKAEEPPEPKEPERPGPLARLDGLRLEDGLVTLDWPGWGLRFEAVTAAGAVHLGGEVGLWIDADLDGGACAATFRRARERVAFRALRIAGFTWEAAGFRTDELRLTGEGDARVALRGGMGFDGDVTLEATGDARLGPPELGVAVTRWLPGGAALDGLEARLAQGRLEASAARAEAAAIAAGPVRAAGVSLPARVELAPGTLTPRVVLHTEGARAREIVGPEGLAARDVAVGRLDVALDGGANLELADARLGALTLPGGEVGAATLEGGGKVGLGGGTLAGSFRSDQGTVEATGRVEVSLLKRRADLTVDATLEGVRGALAATLAAALPERSRGVLHPPVRGAARFAGEVAPPAGGEPWRLAFVLQSADLSGRGRVLFTDGDWTEASAHAGPAP